MQKWSNERGSERTRKRLAKKEGSELIDSVTSTGRHSRFAREFIKTRLINYARSDISFRYSPSWLFDQLTNLLDKTTIIYPTAYRRQIRGCI